MKDDIQILLDRREEIRKQINKLEAEYGALGNVITVLFKYKQKEKDKEDGREERM